VCAGGVTMNRHGEVTMPKSRRTASNGVQTSNLPDKN